MAAGLAAWEAALTQMEDELNAHEEQVRLGEPTLTPAWEPPTDLGPLPAQLADRVSHLVSRIGLLSTFVQYQMQAAESDLKHTQQQSAAKGSVNKGIALFLDASV